MAKKKTTKKKAKKVPTPKIHRSKKVLTKKVKKTAKKKVTKKKTYKAKVVYFDRTETPFCGFTEIEAAAKLDQKILTVSHDTPEIEASGSCSTRTGEEFKFTIYADVMKILLPILNTNRMVFRPYSDEHHQSRATMAGGWYFVHTYYTLRDADTGYGIIVPGFGLGQNDHWAADSAGTLALKHSLLQTLMVAWDNRSAIQAMTDSIKSKAPQLVVEIMREALSSAGASKEMQEFFGKEQTHGTGKKRK